MVPSLRFGYPGSTQVHIQYMYVHAHANIHAHGVYWPSVYSTLYIKNICTHEWRSLESLDTMYMYSVHVYMSLTFTRPLVPFYIGLFSSNS